ncbi:hypothetical protein [uncultured Ruminococcus sp.]|uniref:hypothetical protein n=1 Tax=uncultured Ruminococcus sp. TaxID=165186 RepID=UPI0026756DFD|nr:hypothetical protein [uncultured Ruminococcus sp.]
MDYYISMEDWCELSKWLEISQGFYEAYTRFRLEGTEVHWMSFNFCDKCIEVAFSYLDSSYDQIDVMVYCPNVEKSFTNRFFWTKTHIVTKNGSHKKSLQSSIGLHGVHWNRRYSKLQPLTQTKHFSKSGKS